MNGKNVQRTFVLRVIKYVRKRDGQIKNKNKLSLMRLRTAQITEMLGTDDIRRV